MSTTSNRHWGQTLRTVFARTERHAKPKRHDAVHRMNYLDDARMARELGHL